MCVNLVIYKDNNILSCRCGYPNDNGGLLTQLALNNRTDLKESIFTLDVNRLTPNDPYMGRTATLTSKRLILYIYSTNIGTEYFKHALYPPFFSLQNAVCFIMLTCLVPLLLTFHIQSVLKLKKKINSGAKGLIQLVKLCPR